MPSRRQFLIGAAALSAACNVKSSDTGDTAAGGAPVRAPEPEPWAGLYPVDETLFQSGVAAGDATAEGIVLSTRTTAPEVGLVLYRADGEAWVEAEVREAIAVDDGGVQVTLDGLEADTAYSYAFTANGAQSRVGRFRTALGADGWRVVTFGATSCLGGNAPWPSMSHAAAENLDFALLLGDTVYADGSRTVADYRSYWAAATFTAGLKDLTSSTSVIATWDDHEVDNNWSWETTDSIEAKFEAGLQVFGEHLPRGPGGGVAGIWRALSWGAVLDVFVLDCRSERADGNYISEAQMDFLLQALSDSPARFKIVANPVPITDYAPLMGDVLAEDRWQGFPAQREQLLAHIRDEGITGVLFVAGDFHLGQVSRVDPPGGTGEGIYEVLAGPAGSFLNPIASLAETDDQWISFVDQWNTVTFEADPVAGVITTRFLGDDGGVLAEIALNL